MTEKELLYRIIRFECILGKDRKDFTEEEKNMLISDTSRDIMWHKLVSKNH